MATYKTWGAEVIFRETSRPPKLALANYPQVPDGAHVRPLVSIIGTFLYVPEEDLVLTSWFSRNQAVLEETRPRDKVSVQLLLKALMMRMPVFSVVCHQKRPNQGATSKSLKSFKKRPVQRRRFPVDDTKF